MNTLRKTTLTSLLVGFTFISAPSAQAHALGFSLPVPNISSLTAEVGRVIAADLAVYLRKSVKAPRVSRPRQSPSVSVEAMETVVVVASRLPPEEQDLPRTAQARTEVRF